jgi:uncharacterized membrane protein YwzB
MGKAIKEFFKNRNLIVHVIWICVIVYAIASINVLILALRSYRYLPGAYLDPRSLLLFAVISFLLVVIIAAYHLSTLIRRRKRRSDRLKISRRKYLRAKHRHPGRLHY